MRHGHGHAGRYYYTIFTFPQMDSLLKYHSKRFDDSHRFLYIGMTQWETNDGLNLNVLSAMVSEVKFWTDFANYFHLRYFLGSCQNL